MSGWLVVKGVAVDGKTPEFQVSDAIPSKRTTSYDFKSYHDAKEFCDELNRQENDNEQRLLQRVWL